MQAPAWFLTVKKETSGNKGQEGAALVDFIAGFSTARCRWCRSLINKPLVLNLLQKRVLVEVLNPQQKGILTKKPIENQRFLDRVPTLGAGLCKTTVIVQKFTG